MPPSPLTVVTGASRGLGLALVRQLLDAGHRVLALARHAPPLEHAALTVWRADLADPAPVADRLAAWLAEPAQRPPQVGALHIVHNAGVLSTLAPLQDVPAAELANALRVGLEAPLLLSSAFLRATEGTGVPRRLLLVSSGLGRRAMAGSASYCAAKAGLDHLARAIALEQAGRPHGARVVSLAPGVIDTDMQTQLRAADAAAFPDRERFVALKTSGQLDSPQAAAAKLLRWLERPDFGDVPVADVRDA